MKTKDPFAGLQEVWARVEASKPQGAGAARLMPRREKTSRAARFLPPFAAR